MVDKEIAGDRLPSIVKIGWGFGSAGTATILYAYSVLLLYFFTAVLGVHPGLAGTILFAVKILDAVGGPVTGILSDRTRSRWGRRRPYLFAGAVASALGLAVVFNPPAVSIPALVACLAVMAAGYCLFNVPYLAMASEMTDSPTERTKLMSWRIMFNALGGATATAALPFLAKTLGGGRYGYGVTGVVAGAVAFVAMLTVGVVTRGRVREPDGAQAGGDGATAWVDVLRNRPFLLLLSAKVLQLFGFSAVSASLLFFFKSALSRAEGSVALWSLAATAASILSMPLWVAAASRLGKRNVYVLGVLGYALLGYSWLLAGPGEPIERIIGRALLSGMFSGGLLLMGQAILPDTIAWGRTRSGLRREGVYAGIYSFVEKGSTALGPLAIGWILALMGFVPKIATGAAQSADGLRAVYISMAIVPATAYVLSIVPLAFYRLDERRLAALAPAPAA